MYLKCFNTNKGNLSLRTWPSHCKKKKNYNNVHYLNNTIIVLIMIVMLMKCGYLSWQVTIGCRCIGCRRMLPHEIFATFNFANYLRICKKDIKFPPRLSPISDSHVRNIVQQTSEQPALILCRYSFDHKIQPFHEYQTALTCKPLTINTIIINCLLKISQNKEKCQFENLIPPNFLN